MNWLLETLLTLVILWMVVLWLLVLLVIASAFLVMVYPPSAEYVLGWPLRAWAWLMGYRKEED